MKSAFLKFFSQPLVAKRLVRFLLHLDNFIYKCISTFVLDAEGGVHPKHEILKYKDWFNAKVSPKDVVLDIGCNTGSLLKFLSSNISKGYGIDIVEKFIEKARIQNAGVNIEYYLGDATEFDFKKFEGLTVITMSNVLEHIEERVDFLEKCKSCLDGKPCKLLIRVPLITRDWLSCYKKQIGIDYRLDPTHFTEYTKEEIYEELGSVKIKIIESEIRFGEIFLECQINPC